MASKHSTAAKYTEIHKGDINSDKDIEMQYNELHMDIMKCFQGCTVIILKIIKLMRKMIMKPPSLKMG